MPLKLFLDVVPSSSGYVTRAMHGQSNRLSRSYLRENGGKVILFVWFRFIPEMFSACSAASLYGRPFVCLSACLAVHYFAVYMVLESLIKQTSTATSTMAVWACIIILCSFLCRCLQKFTKQQREIATFCIFVDFERTWNLRLFVWLPSLCLRVCLLCTRLSKHFSAVHSVVIAWARVHPTFI